MSITFNYEQVEFALKGVNQYKKWIKTVIEEENKKLGNINYIFCSDDYLLEINQRYLNHDTYTDIITFDYSEDSTVSGDIYISIDRVGENAKEFGTTFNEELRRVIIHGILHLCDYLDKTKAQEKIMRKKENDCLILYVELTEKTKLRQ